MKAEQRHREAAAEFVEAVRAEGYRLGHHHDYRAGKADQAALVQAFVKFDAERTARIEEAESYLRGLLVSYVNQYCDPVPEWKPLDDLLGMLTQMDNASTVTGELLARALAAEQTVAEAGEVVRPFARTRTECALGITASNETQTRCDHCTDPKMLCFAYRAARAFIASLKEQPHG